MLRPMMPLVLVALTLLLHITALRAAPVDDIKALLARGMAKEAYARGRLFPDQLGEPIFDYHFGIAAIDAGHPAEGTLALERYIVAYPDDLRARLELARGYFQLGDNGRSRDEFESVMKADPPPAVRTQVERYLEAIRDRESGRGVHVTFTAEAGAGYDTNVNGGVSSGIVSLPIGTVLVQPSGVAKDNGFVMAAAAVRVTVPVTPEWSGFVGVNGDTKNHFTQDPFDLRSLGIAAGAARRSRDSLYRVTASTGTLLLDDTRFRDVHGIAGEWYRQHSPATTLIAIAQIAQVGYTGGNAARDADIFSATGGLTQALGGRYAIKATGTLTLGREHNRRSRSDLARDFYGLRAACQATLPGPIDVAVGASVQRSEYRDADAFLAVTRRDWYSALDVAAEYALSKQWTLRGELLLSRNDSNVDLYAFTRDVAQLKLRYELR